MALLFVAACAADAVTPAPAAKPVAAEPAARPAVPVDGATMITVNLRNDCDAPRRFVLDDAGRGPLPADAEILTLGPSEHRKIEVPAGAWVRTVGEDGAPNSGASLDAGESGGWIVLACDGIRASREPLPLAPRNGRPGTG